MYTLFNLLAGGTFTTGAGADWRTQFGVPDSFFASPTLGGEILYPGTSSHVGIYAAQTFWSPAAFDASVYVGEASGGAPVQVWVNGVLISEQASAALVTCPFVAGLNLVEYVRSLAPLVVAPSGPLFGPALWASPFKQGSDPYAALGGSSGGPSFGSGFRTS